MAGTIGLAYVVTRWLFIDRFPHEPWHFGFGPNPRDRQHPAQYDKGSWEPPGGRPW